MIGRASLKGFLKEEMDDPKGKGKAQASKYEENKGRDTNEPKKANEKDSGKNENN